MATRYIGTTPMLLDRLSFSIIQIQTISRNIIPTVASLSNASYM